MIPQLICLPGVTHRLLPPGIHVASLSEIEDRFAFNAHRQELFGGFERVVDALRAAGCVHIFLDGSFASDKVMPEDFDGCWDPKGVNLKTLDPVFLDFENNRRAQKEKYKGEMFPANIAELSGKTFIEFFQVEKSTGAAKGIVRVQQEFSGSII